jgi:cysteine-rich repeat protein
MRRLLGVMIVASGALAACHDELPPPPTGLAIQPTEGPNDRSTKVTISGDFVYALVSVNLDDPSQSTIDNTLSAKLGDFSLTNVALAKSGGITATVPGIGMPAGAYDLTVIDADGRTALLGSAFRVFSVPVGCNDDRDCPMPATCGDGKLGIGEECDDGNTRSGDGCGPTCQVEPGWNCVGEPSTCVMTAMTVCNAPYPPNCGNGILEPNLNETCDDGNNTAGDGCTPCCTVEPGFGCYGNPSLCAPEGDFVYVQDRATGCPGEGRMADPYCRIQAGVDDGRPFVIIGQGDYFESVVIEGKTRTLVAKDPNVVLRSASLALDVHGGSNVLVVGMSIQAQGNVVAIASSGTSAAFSGCTIGPSAGVGLTTDAAVRLIVDRTIVRMNTGGGLLIQTPSYRITNAIVAANGSNGDMGTNPSMFGGVALLATSSTAIFANDTIVDNASSNRNGVVPGVFCMTSASVVNSIVWQTQHGNGDLISPRCATTYSDVRSTAQSSTNFNVDPQFVSEAFLISESSPCVDAGDPRGVSPLGPAPTHDYTGQRRPKGQRVDVGAYEVR